MLFKGVFDDIKHPIKLKTLKMNKLKKKKSLGFPIGRACEIILIYFFVINMIKS